MFKKYPGNDLQSKMEEDKLALFEFPGHGVKEDEPNGQ